jgi:hypothetical protein
VEQRIGTEQAAEPPRRIGAVIVAVALIDHRQRNALRRAGRTGKTRKDLQSPRDSNLSQLTHYRLRNGGTVPYVATPLPVAGS